MSGKITVVTESSQPVVDNSHTIYETPKPAVEVVQKVAVEVVESSQTVVNDLQSENDKPKVEPRKSKNIGEKPQVEGEKKKGINKNLCFIQYPHSHYIHCHLLSHSSCVLIYIFFNLIQKV